MDGFGAVFFLHNTLMSWIDFLSDFEIVFYYPEKSIPRFTSRLKSFSREVACYFFVKVYELVGTRIDKNRA